MLCGALRMPLTQSNAFRELQSVITSIFRAQLSPQSNSGWHSYRLTFDNATLENIDLSGISFATNGGVSATSLTVSGEGMNLSGLTLSAGAAVVMRQTLIDTGTFSLRGLVCEEGSSLLFDETTLRQGKLDFSSSTISRGAAVSISR